MLMFIFPDRLFINEKSNNVYDIFLSKQLYINHTIVQRPLNHVHKPVQ